MQDSRTYAPLTGVGKAFGWGVRRENGWQVTLGHLAPAEKYMLDGADEIVTDNLGGWAGIARGYMPRCISHVPDGRLVLFDEEKISYDDAVLLARRSREIQKTITEKPKDEAKIKAESVPVIYRTRLNGSPVDVLPEIKWPEEAKEVRPYFEQYKPVRLLEAASWRFVCVQDHCFVGRRVQGGRVCEIAWALQARGAMLPPKGLEGYRYVRCADGKACWMLTKKV